MCHAFHTKTYDLPTTVETNLDRYKEFNKQNNELISTSRLTSLSVYDDNKENVNSSLDSFFMDKSDEECFDPDKPVDLPVRSHRRSTLSSGRVKTRKKHLMFFTGCPAHLGCTIMLRGGTNQELSRVKNVVRFMVYILFNWKFEKSFLLQERALISSHQLDSYRNMDDSDDVADETQSTLNITDIRDIDRNLSCAEEEEEDADRLTNKNKQLHKNERKHNVLKKIDSNISRSSLPIPASPNRIGKIVSDFSDPLRSDVLPGSSPRAPSEMVVDNVVSDKVEENVFRKALNDVVLCASPYIKKSMPFLETEAGQKSRIRKFFPSTLYYSVHLDKENAGGRSRHRSDRKDLDSDEVIPPVESEVAFVDPHPYLTESSLSCGDEASRTLALADFRAFGGQLRLEQHTYEELDQDWALKPWNWANRNGIKQKHKIVNIIQSKGEHN